MSNLNCEGSLLVIFLPCACCWRHTRVYMYMTKQVIHLWWDISPPLVSAVTSCYFVHLNWLSWQWIVISVLQLVDGYEVTAKKSLKRERTNSSGKYFFSACEIIEKEFGKWLAKCILFETVTFALVQSLQTTWVSSCGSFITAAVPVSWSCCWNVM